MQSLYDIYRSCPIIKSSLDTKDIRPASSIIHLQLKPIVSEAIDDLEKAVLSKIDGLVQGTISIGRQNPLALWACLWILILSYKEHMIHTKPFQNRCKSSSDSKP